MRGQPRGWSRSVSRGTCRPAIEPRNQPVWGADAVSLCGRQHPVQQERELARDPTGSETPRMHGNTSHENREIPGFLRRAPPMQGWWSAAGSRKTHAADARAWEVIQLRSTEEGLEQGQEAGGGETGGKAAGQAELAVERDTPDTVPGHRVVARGQVRRLVGMCAVRQSPFDARQEPGTVVPYAGIRGGG